MSLVLFVHILGTAMWIGGTLAGLVVVSTAQDEPGPVRAGAFRIVARLHTMVIGFGALLVLGSGVILGSSSGWRKCPGRAKSPL